RNPLSAGNGAADGSPHRKRIQVSGGDQPNSALDGAHAPGGVRADFAAGRDRVHGRTLMPATLVPKLVPAPAAVRPIQRNQPAAAGEKFDAALSEARQANQPTRRAGERTPEPTKSKAATAANKSDKPSRNDKPSKVRPKGDRDDAAVDSADKAPQAEA